MVVGMDAQPTFFLRHLCSPSIAVIVLPGMRLPTYFIAQYPCFDRFNRSLALERGPVPELHRELPESVPAIGEIHRETSQLP